MTHEPHIPIAERHAPQLDPPAAVPPARHGLFWSASPRRAATEVVALIAAGALLLFALVVPNITASPLAGGLNLERALIFGALVIGMAGAFLLALRFRLHPGVLLHRLRDEALVGLLLALLMSPVYAGVLGAVALRDSTLFQGSWNTTLLIVGLIVAGLPVLHGIGFMAVRAGFAALRHWNVVRRRRLLWALTHDMLMVVLVLMLVLGIGATLTVYVSDTLTGTVRGTLIDQVLGVSLLGGFYTLLTGMLLIGTFPLAILLSLVLVQRIVRRVEQLAIATRALRQGDYKAQVPVAGHDELAQLQTDFNAMATDLDRTLVALQGERDRVAGLLQAQRELTASVSHELRTPVATQRSYLDALLHNDTTLPPQVRDDLRVVQRENHRLQYLIDDLFILSRAEIGRLTLRIEPCDVGAIAERVAAVLAPIAWQQGRVTIGAQVVSEGTLALADEARVEQIMRNLVHNSVRHTPPGGIVAITISAEPTEIVVQVHDTGSGIAPEALPQIWNRFYRADDARALDQHGAGLGLALVKELTEAMGGSVGVESTLGTGSVFCVRLLRADMAS